MRGDYLTKPDIQPANDEFRQQYARARKAEARAGTTEIPVVSISAPWVGAGKKSRPASLSS
jgi:hypothetical protein